MVRAPGKYKHKRGGGRNFSKEMQFDRGVGEVKTRDEDDEDEDGSGEESEEESDEDEESDEPSASVSAAQPELTRAQRREMKKKQGGKEKAKAEAKAKGKKNVGEGDDGVEEEEEEDEDEEDEEKEGGEDKGDDDFLVNPNHVQKKMTISDLNKPRELTRREREQKEKQEAAERYRKLHLQGKTEEAKNDLHRLAQIRAEREAALAKRKAEAGAKLKEVEERKKAQLTRKK